MSHVTARILLFLAVAAFALAQAQDAPDPGAVERHDSGATEHAQEASERGHGGDGGEAAEHAVDHEMAHDTGAMDGEGADGTDPEGMGATDHEGMGGMAHGDAEAPAELDLATEKASARGRFRASYVSEPSPAPLNELHAWTLHVETRDGTPVEDAVIRVGGGMPQHEHGLPTNPQVTRDLGDGDYLVEGLRFHMSGRWTIEFVIEAGDASDTVGFDLLVD